MEFDDLGQGLAPELREQEASLRQQAAERAKEAWS